MLERQRDQVSRPEAGAAAWLRARRVRIALLLAAGEGLIAVLADGAVRFAVLFVATALVALYLVGRTKVEWDLAKQVLWIVGASQALALLAAVSTFVLGWTALLLVAGVAAIALLLADPDTRQR